MELFDKAGLSWLTSACSRRGCDGDRRRVRPDFSFTEGVAKPDPEIYLRALHRLGVQPEAAIFIGDGGDNELAGAEEAGLRAFRATWFLTRWPQFRSWEGAGLRLAGPQDVLKLVTAG